MKKLWKIIGLIFVVCSAGCSSNAPPTCTDTAVKNKVCELSEQLMFKHLLPRQMNQTKARQIVDESDGTPIDNEYRKIDMLAQGIAYGTLPMEYFLKYAEVSKTAALLKEDIFRQIKEMKLSLDGVRIGQENQGLKKVICEANLVNMNGSKLLPIRYSAQRTEDNKLWVEVSGL